MMSFTLKSVDGLIFLSYLTKYNIRTMNEVIDVCGDISIEEFMQRAGHDNRIRAMGYPQQLIEECRSDALICSYKLDYYKVKTETVYGDRYPAKLKRISSPPPLLYYKGTLRRNKLAAIVGTRKPTNMASKMIPLLVEVFNKHGYGIVSGLAFGIDSIAHQAALEQSVYTLSVMPNALDSIYPKEHYKLANQILDSGGALVSELAFGISHGKKSFVQRNRIQAGMSEMVLPLEMGIKSGTMTTVEFAYAQDKFILLVPPKEEHKLLEQYEGVNHFINKSMTEKYRKTYLINDLMQFDAFLRDNSSVNQGNLF
jgi:DNA protecting protein DprA